MVKKYKKYMQEFYYCPVLLLTTGACSDSFLQTDSPNQPSQTYLLANRVGRFDGSDCLL